MRLLGLLSGGAAGFVITAVLDAFVPELGSWIGTVAIFACSGVGYLAGSAVDALDRLARAQRDTARILELPWLVATGQVTLADLVEVRVPDAPPEDLGGET